VVHAVPVGVIVDRLNLPFALLVPVHEIASTFGGRVRQTEHVAVTDAMPLLVLCDGHRQLHDALFQVPRGHVSARVSRPA